MHNGKTSKKVIFKRKLKHLLCNWYSNLGYSILLHFKKIHEIKCWCMIPPLILWWSFWYYYAGFCVKSEFMDWIYRDLMPETNNAVHVTKVLWGFFVFLFFLKILSHKLNCSSINKSTCIGFLGGYFEFLFFHKILFNKFNCQSQTRYSLELVFPNWRFFTTQWHTLLRYTLLHVCVCVCKPFSSLLAIRIFPSPSLDSHLIWSKSAKMAI